MKCLIHFWIKYYKTTIASLFSKMTKQCLWRIVFFKDSHNPSPIQLALCKVTLPLPHQEVESNSFSSWNLGWTEWLTSNQCNMVEVVLYDSEVRSELAMQFPPTFLEHSLSRSSFLGHSLLENQTLWMRNTRYMERPRRRFQLSSASKSPQSKLQTHE